MRAHGVEHRADLDAAGAEVGVGGRKAGAPQHAHGEHPARVHGRGRRDLGPDEIVPLQPPLVALEHACLLLQDLRQQLELAEKERRLHVGHTVVEAGKRVQVALCRLALVVETVEVLVYLGVVRQHRAALARGDHLVAAEAD